MRGLREIMQGPLPLLRASIEDARREVVRQEGGGEGGDEGGAGAQARLVGFGQGDIVFEEGGWGLRGPGVGVVGRAREDGNGRGGDLVRGELRGYVG